MAWAPDYVTLAEMKAYQKIADIDDDTLLAVWITAASRAVDNFCGRQFGKVALVESREYATTYDRHQGCYVAEIDDVQTVGSMIVLDSAANELDTYTLGPVNALLKGKPYERLSIESCGPLTISALWGWTDVPAAVKAATMLQTARLIARRDSPFGVAGSPDDGSALRLLASLDPDLKTALQAYRRNWWAA